MQLAYFPSSSFVKRLLSELPAAPGKLSGGTAGCGEGLGHAAKLWQHVGTSVTQWRPSEWSGEPSAKAQGLRELSVGQSAYKALLSQGQEAPMGQGCCDRQVRLEPSVRTAGPSWVGTWAILRKGCWAEVFAVPYPCILCGGELAYWRCAALQQ